MPLDQTAPPYLAEKLHQSSADEARQRLRSASTSSLVVRRTTRLSAIGDRAFPVAAARLWNTLPLPLVSSISVFRKHLKTHLFSHSFPEFPVVPVQWLCHFGHCSRSFFTYLLTSAVNCDSRRIGLSGRWYWLRIIGQSCGPMVYVSDVSPWPWLRP